MKDYIYYGRFRHYTERCMVKREVVVENSGVMEAKGIAKGWGTEKTTTKNAGSCTIVQKKNRPWRYKPELENDIHTTKGNDALIVVGEINAREQIKGYMFIVFNEEFVNVIIDEQYPIIEETNVHQNACKDLDRGKYSKTKWTNRSETLGGEGKLYKCQA